MRRTGKNGNSKRRRHVGRKMVKRGGAVEENRETVKMSVRGLTYINLNFAKQQYEELW